MRMSKFMRISADADPDAELRYTSIRKVFTSSYYNMETQKCEFHKIKVAKDRKIVYEMALSKVMYRGSVTVHFRCSFAMEYTRPPLSAPAE